MLVDDSCTSDLCTNVTNSKQGGVHKYGTLQGGSVKTQAYGSQINTYNWRRGVIQIGSTKPTQLLYGNVTKLSMSVQKGTWSTFNVCGLCKSVNYTKQTVLTQLNVNKWCMQTSGTPALEFGKTFNMKEQVPLVEFEGPLLYYVIHVKLSTCNGRQWSGKCIVDTGSTFTSLPTELRNSKTITYTIGSLFRKTVDVSDKNTKFSNEKYMILGNTWMKDCKMNFDYDNSTFGIQEYTTSQSYMRVPAVSPLAALIIICVILAFILAFN